MRPLVILCCLVQLLLGGPIAIDFQGNRSFSKETLYEALGIQPPWWKRILSPNQPPVVDEQLLPILMDQLKEFYRDQGFWDVVVELRLEDQRAVFHIQEGRPILVASIEITSDFPITDLIPLRKGERFIASAFTKSKRAIRQELLEAGYCSYDFDAKAFVHKQRYEAYLVYRLQKGAICSIGSITIHGLTTIPERVILSHIDLRPGQPFSLDRLRDSYRRLYSLEYFRFINMDYSRKVANKILLGIEAKERRKRNIYKIGLGFDTQNGIHTSYYYKNVNFHLFQPTIQLFYSNVRKSVELGTFYPSIPILGLFFDSVATLAIEKNRYDSFTQSGYRLSGKLLTGYYHLWASIQLNLERIRISQATGCIHNDTYTLFYPELFALLDKRDSKLAPKKGFFLQDRLDLSLIGDQFLKNEFTAGLLIPYSSFTLFLKGRLGTLFASSIPPNKRFYAGGAKSNRAYTYRQLSALDTPCDIGGKTLLETTIEPRYHYTKELSFALFWDRTYLSATELHLGPYRDGVGLGLLYTTPVGQFKAYFGLDPRDPGQNAINLSIGASF
ncbi:MAG: hypothetical protein C6I00_05825 [Nitratiruptor sp.]|nr:hypothetical protein [Nitratiruptor sp.]NPA83617.1 BamA/TamA family outer membrane protein [Campylobacterota bacterium]